MVTSAVQGAVDGAVAGGLGKVARAVRPRRGSAQGKR
jgi:hypothetical protein